MKNKDKFFITKVVQYGARQPVTLDIETFELTNGRYPKDVQHDLTWEQVNEMIDDFNNHQTKTLNFTAHLIPVKFNGDYLIRY